MSDLILQARTKEYAILAKLLARENLRVEIRNIDTPMFLIESRLLLVPKMKDDVSDIMYVSHIGHEIGHALYTPTDGWEKIVQVDKIPAEILNIVEDARIEKLVKQDYPGMKSILYQSYVEWFNEGAFGVSSLEEANQLPFIDRFNVHFKMGHSFGIEFSEEEMVFVERGNELYSWSDTEALTWQIFIYMKAKATGGSTFTIPDIINVEDFSTQLILDEFKKKLIDHLANTIINVYAVPNDWQKKIVPYNKVLLNSIPKTYRLQALVDYKKFSKQYIDHMVQLFNLKKNALQFQSTTYNKTGDLDLNHIHEYQMIDDLFTRKAIRPKGKSHGLVIFMDWSSSMEENIQYSLYQLFFVTDFCRNLNIPFEVYSFTTTRDSETTTKKYPGSFVSRPYRMVNILSSKMIHKEYHRMQQMLLDRSIQNEYFQKAGTPLNEVIMAATEIVPLFKEQYKLDNVNICFVTDGDGHRLRECYDEDGISVRSIDASKNVYIHDPKTHYVEKLEDGKLTVILLNILRQRTGSNVIGFHLTNPESIFQENLRLRPYINQLKEEKIATIKNLEGYNHYHIIDNALIQKDSRKMDKRFKFLLSQFIFMIT